MCDVVTVSMEGRKGQGKAEDEDNHAATFLVTGMLRISAVSSKYSYSELQRHPDTMITATVHHIQHITAFSI